MTTQSTTRRTGLLLSVALVIGVAALIAITSHGGNQASAAPNKKQNTTNAAVKFTADGELIRPTDYRRWIYAGTPLTPNDMNNGKAAFPEFHSVYIDPDAYSHYEKTGNFPDGTILVKELVSVGTKKPPAATATSWATSLALRYC